MSLVDSDCILKIIGPVSWKLFYFEQKQIHLFGDWHVKLPRIDALNEHSQYINIFLDNLNKKYTSSGIKHCIFLEMSLKDDNTDKLKDCYLTDVVEMLRGKPNVYGVDIRQGDEIVTCLCRLAKNLIENPNVNNQCIVLAHFKALADVLKEKPEFLFNLYQNLEIISIPSQQLSATRLAQVHDYYYKKYKQLVLNYIQAIKVIWPVFSEFKQEMSTNEIKAIALCILNILQEFNIVFMDFYTSIKLLASTDNVIIVYVGDAHVNEYKKMLFELGGVLLQKNKNYEHQYIFHPELDTIF